MDSDPVELNARNAHRSRDSRHSPGVGLPLKPCLACDESEAAPFTRDFFTSEVAASRDDGAGRSADRDARTTAHCIDVFEIEHFVALLHVEDRDRATPTSSGQRRVGLCIVRSSILNAPAVLPGRKPDFGHTDLHAAANKETPGPPFCRHPPPGAALATQLPRLTAQT